MFIERLLNQGSAPLLEQVVRFSADRHRLITENIANVDTPDYQQKDLSVERFQAMLRQRIERGGHLAPGDVSFGDIGGQIENPVSGILFHDRNNRSMEQLATDLAKNAMMHNLAIELLRKQFQTMEMALKDKVT
jgi:flagellar basal-body rod protein FlgB